MSERTARIARTTKETDIELSIDLDGTGATDIDTGIGFFDHMLTAFGRHGLFDLSVRAEGDLEVDGDHTVEDVGIVAGQAFASALGDKRGIRRFVRSPCPWTKRSSWRRSIFEPRPTLLGSRRPGSHGGLLRRDARQGVLHRLRRKRGRDASYPQVAGENTHHVIEGMFKAVARAMRQAVEADPRMGDALPTTKGAL